MNTFGEIKRADAYGSKLPIPLCKFILLFRCLTRYHSVITPILSNTFLVVWQGEDKAVKPSCDSVTTRQRISKTFILCILRIICIKTVVSLSHCLPIKWQKEYWTIAIHRLSTAYPPDGPLLILFYECLFRTFNRAKPFTPLRGGITRWKILPKSKLFAQMLANVQFLL